AARSSLRALALGRIEQLLPVAARHRMSVDAVALRPLAVGQMGRAEHAVEEGKVDREIDGDRFLLDAVMPMMKARHHEDLFQKAEAGADIGMDEGRIDVED